MSNSLFSDSNKITDLTPEQFRIYAKAFSLPIQEQMTMFRHMTKQKQDEFLNLLDMSSLYVRIYLGRIQEIDNKQYEVAKRY